MSRFRDKPRSEAIQGKMGDARESWVRVNVTELILYETESITVALQQGNRRFSVNLTALTEAELDAMEIFMTRAFNMARPICHQLDTEAQEAFQNGDDSLIRSYRAVPQLHVRDRSKRQHRAGVPSRSGRVAELGNDAEWLAAHGITGDAGGQVPDRQPPDVGTEDD